MFPRIPLRLPVQNLRGRLPITNILWPLRSHIYRNTVTRSRHTHINSKLPQPFANLWKSVCLLLEHGSHRSSRCQYNSTIPTKLFFFSLLFQRARSIRHALRTAPTKAEIYVNFCFTRSVFGINFKWSTLQTLGPHKSLI